MPSSEPAPDPAAPTGGLAALDGDRLRALRDGFAELVWVTDADGLLVNDMPTWREVTGQTPEELSGLGWLEGVHPDDRADVLERWQAAHAARTTFETEYRIVGPGGERHLQVRGTPALDPTGRLTGYVGVCLDVSDARRGSPAERRLRRTLEAERELLQLVIERAPTAIAVLEGPEHRFRFFNAAFAELAPPGRMAIGRTTLEALPEVADAIPLMERARHGEEVRLPDLLLPFDDERSLDGFRHYDVAYSPVGDDVPADGILIVATETTELVRERTLLEGRLREERRLAEGLQRALLPDAGLDPAGLDVARHYRPASVEAGVGGDWHDVLDLGDAGVLLVIGDVCGRGLDAATAMAQLRAAARAYAVEDADPVRLLERLAHLDERLGLAEFVTVGACLVTPQRREATWASAGHLPLLVHRPDGAVDLLGAPGRPVGAPDATFAAAHVALEAGTTLLLYTDGLVEHRRIALDVRLEALRAAVAGALPDAEALCRRALALVEEGDGVDDDVALLACRVP